MWFCWLAFIVNIGNGMMFTVLNLFVHGIMYNYYAIRCLGIYIPNPLRKSITAIQIVQMVWGAFVILIFVVYWTWCCCSQYRLLLLAKRSASSGACHVHFLCIPFRRSLLEDVHEKKKK